MGILRTVSTWLFDRDPPAATLASSIDRSISAMAPQPPAFVPDPPAIAVQVYHHAGKRFERLSEQQQEEAQARLFRRLKARQRELGIQWDTDEIDMDVLPDDFADRPLYEQMAYWGDEE